MDQTKSILRKKRGKLANLDLQVTKISKKEKKEFICNLIGFFMRLASRMARINSMECHLNN